MAAPAMARYGRPVDPSGSDAIANPSHESAESASEPAPHLPAEVPTHVAQYLAGVPADRVPALLNLRAEILATVPEPFEERAAYGIITVDHAGGVVGYGATDKHCALYVMDPPLVARLKPELGGFAASGGTIRFQPANPLPAELVQRIVAERVAANQERAQAKAQARRTRTRPPRASTT